MVHAWDGTSRRCLWPCELRVRSLTSAAYRVTIGARLGSSHVMRADAERQETDLRWNLCTLPARTVRRPDLTINGGTRHMPTSAAIDCQVVPMARSRCGRA